MQQCVPEREAQESAREKKEQRGRGGPAQGCLITLIKAGGQNHKQEVSVWPSCQPSSHTPSPENTAAQTLATWVFTAALGHSGQKAETTQCPRSDKRMK